MRSILSVIAMLIPAMAMSAAAAKANQASLVVDADAGTVILEQDANHLWYPASLTKMMTLYLTFATIDAGRLGFEDSLTASAFVASQPDSRIGLNKGDKMTVREAVLAVIAQSANDAAVLLAEKLAGSESGFAAMMTGQAHKLGMMSTEFRNATGLPHEAQTTTARDMALLAIALLHDFPQHYHLFNVRSFSYRGITYSNINSILGSYPGADGLKTGFTCGSGYNLVASAKRDARRLVGVLLGAGSGSERTSAMVRLLDAGFAKAQNGEGKLMLAALEPQGRIRDEPPPFRLKASECSLGTGISGHSQRLPGWGLLFGAFEEQAQARKHADAARTRLKGVLSGGQIAVVRRQVET